MSTAYATRPHTAGRLRLLAWTTACLGVTGLVTALVNPVAGLVVGAVMALMAFTANALRRAQRRMDAILDEELD